MPESTDRGRAKGRGKNKAYDIKEMEKDKIHIERVRRIDALFDTLFVEPHSLTLGFFLMIAIVRVALERDTITDTVGNVKFGFVAAAMTFLVFMSINDRDSPMIRPHPVIWRIVLGTSVLYLCFTVFMLFQNIDDARHWLTYLYPNLGQPLPERSYGDSCDLTFANLKDVMFDEFVLAHILGWFGKAIVLRDFPLLLVTSVLFEILEITFKDMMHNFRECWWDQVIVDLLVCNVVGMYLGFWMIHYFEAKTYEWVPFKQLRGFRARFKRSLLQMTPHHLDRYEWRLSSDAKRFLHASILVLLVNVNDLNSFFLKYALWIPPRNPLNSIRLTFWFLWSLPGSREFYRYVSEPACKRFGSQAWVCCAILLAESLLVYRYSTDRVFPQPLGEYFPGYVRLMWAAILVVWVCWVVFLLLRHRGQKIGGVGGGGGGGGVRGSDGGGSSADDASDLDQRKAD